MPWTDQDLEKIRVNLTTTDRLELGKRFNLRPGSVRNILSGLSNNPSFLIAAVELIEEREKLIIAKKQTLASL